MIKLSHSSAMREYLILTMHKTRPLTMQKYVYINYAWNLYFNCAAHYLPNIPHILEMHKMPHLSQAQNTYFNYVR